jgi:ABC-type amino acid transport substrate-binding protein
MRKLVTLPAILLAGSIGWACGDKLMLVMGARHLVFKNRPAVILAFTGNSRSAGLIRSLSSQPALKKAGHRFQLVEDFAGLDSALKAGKYDLVMADLANATDLSQHVSADASKAVVLPVAYQASKEEQSLARKRYHCLLKAPDSTDNYLDDIDLAMEWKLKGTNR